MSKIICDMTGCRYNSSCCTSPSDRVECTCTLDSVYLQVDDEFHCSNFEEDYDKEVECTRCQIAKYGGIKLNSHLNELDFEEH